MTEMSDYSKFIALSRYARWIESEGRRETWPETVDRYMRFMVLNMPTEAWTDGDFDEIRSAILNLEVMPSMRLLMTAGPAAARDNTCAYNCSYMPVDSPRAFDEAMYILMCGVGVGFSVERQYLSHLPVVNEHFEKSATCIIVDDSKAGWARGLRELIAMLYAGQVPSWDVSKLRPAGARLHTFGGRASGPAPLVELFRFCVETFKSAAGRKLTSTEAHDIMCKIGEVVVVGGVRRSAMISLSNLSDDRMRSAKTGQWWERHQHRALANNSAVYTEKPDMGIFMSEWSSLYNSKSGERGIFNREAARNQVARNGRRDPAFDWGTNPCSEIILRPQQFCNLTEVVVRPWDTHDSLARKVRIATILGTYQATLTNFKYLRKVWKSNTEEERLLGVSLTGLMNKPGLFDHVALSWLKEEAIKTNKEWAEKLGINQSTAITCVKPSGTVSQLVGCPSGIHPAHSTYYIRRVRNDIKDPITALLIAQGVPNEPDTMNANNVVFSFPMAMEAKTIVRKDISAVQHLDIWKKVQHEWCEHKVSITVSVKEHEWLEVGAWCYKNFDILSGVSFLPYADHSYTQAPYEEITEEEYNRLQESMPKGIEWAFLKSFETEDQTKGSQELSCVAGFCDVP
jgi:ribonucleoside-triphosphate reductase (thioredoxin)